ncbi:hypothetical protein PFISCL1PPCAC_13792, partial [Pristionchus fissidentatus]
LQQRMVRQLLVVAALVGAAAAAGEYSTIFKDCACGPALQTYNLTSAAYCPTSSFPKCDITKLVETDCMVSCPGPRANVVFRNSTSIWQPTSSIICGNDGILRNSAGAILFAATPTLMRPTCGYKAACDECSVSMETMACPTGYTCKSELLQTTAEDGCARLKCAAGQLTMYENAVQLSYKASQMYCTTSGLWSNFSLDGGMSGGQVLNKVFTANCILPKTCENCSTPTMATTLTQLPTTFRTGYSIKPAIYTKKVGECSTVRCPDGYKLHGFNGANASVTGLEYTYAGWMECAANSMWADGPYSPTPQSMVAACLRKEYACGCQYSAQPCSNCDSTLVAKLPPSGGQTCGLDCPMGYRMIVARGLGGAYSRVHDMTCNGTVWKAAYWLAGHNVFFTPAEAHVTCEPSPFPYDFPWPVDGMDCAYPTCQNDNLRFFGGAISCSDPSLNLVVSHARSTLANAFAMTSITWNGATWSGFDVTGVHRSFDRNVHMTCYSGTVPPHVSIPCSCTYGQQYCFAWGGNCDPTLVAKKPLNGEEKCSIGCPAGHRMIVARGKDGNYYRMEDLTCSGDSWRGVYWQAGYDANFTLNEPFVTCEPSPFPIDFTWPLTGMSCAPNQCRNEKLIYTVDALTCSAGTLAVSTVRDSLVNPFALVSIKWTGSQWTGVDTTTSEVRTFPSSVFITCYDGVVPTPLPATTTTPNPCGAFDEYALDGATINCEDGQHQIECEGGVEVLTASKVEPYDKMAFVAGKGWLSFDCNGNAKLWKKTDADPILAISCEK